MIYRATLNLLALALFTAPCPSLSPAQIIGGRLDFQTYSVGQDDYDALGHEICGPGDLNGDGIPDYLVASIGHHDGRGLVTAKSGSNGLILWTSKGAASDDAFGTAMIPMGDLDGDSIPDIAVSAPYNDSLAFNCGKIYVLSGATGYILWGVASPTEKRHLGTTLGAADVNGDGFLDVLAGMPDADHGAFEEAGKISAYSGVGGSFLGDAYGTGSFRWLGTSVSGVGDLNGDGCEDFAVGAPGRDSGGLINNGRVALMSGAALTGSGGTLVLARLNGGQTGEEFGSSVASMGDLNQDGFQDLLVGSPYFNDPQGNDDVGRVQLYSGIDYALLGEYVDPEPEAGEHFGRTLSPGGDIDHDGILDLLIGAPAWERSFGNHAGAVFAFSGRTGLMILEVRGINSGGQLGTGLASIGDLDGNGTAEFFCGAPQASVNGYFRAGANHGYGLDPFLSLDKLLASPGETVELQMDFPDSNGWYQVLVSTTGEGQILLGATLVPLADLATPLGINHYPSFTQDMMGLLDIDGKSSATLNLPDALPSMSLYFAAVQSVDGASVSRSSILQTLQVD